MTLRLALRRLLPLLAVLGLALAPVTASAAAAGLRAPTLARAPAMPDGTMDDMAAGDRAGMAMDGMPCCPHETPAMPDCSKGCPLMALCLAKVASGLPAGAGLPMRVAVTAGVTWAVTASFDSLARDPPPEPPRS